MNYGLEEHRKLTEGIIGAAIDVHRGLGPGLLECANAQCLCYELSLREIPFHREVEFPLAYKEVKLDCGFRTDLIVAETVLVELKAVAELLLIHEAQLLTYLKVTGLKIGLLLNFNVALMRDGIVRRVL